MGGRMMEEKVRGGGRICKGRRSKRGEGERALNVNKKIGFL